MSLAKKTLSGFIWTLTSRLGTRVIILIVGIVLARLLTPEDFGLVAMLHIFFSVSSSLVDSGFTHSLIREKFISDSDKNTVFSINILSSISIYVILWIGAPLISSFFNQPQLIWLTRLMGLDILFRALSIVQRAILAQSLQFKLLSKVDIGVAIITGIIAIILAFSGFGVWALAIKFILSSLLISIILFSNNPWFPNGFIDRDSFKRLFGFGSKLLITGLLNTFYNNIYNLIIGKFFSPAILGFYNRAHTFLNQTQSTLLVALGQVTYPILSKTRDDKERLKSAYRKIIATITFVNLPLIIILGFAAEPFIIVILGLNWIDTIPFMRLLCVGALVAHLGSINQGLFKVIGRSDIFLLISIKNKVFTTVAVLIGFYFGIWGIVISSIISEYFTVYQGMYYTAKHINYPIKEQLNDIFPISLLLIPLIITLTIIFSIDINSKLIELLLILILGSGVYLFTAYVSKAKALIQINDLLLPYLKKFA